MKKYDIFLNEIDNKTPEAFDTLCRDFAAEFSISFSGAKILLKQLPALLEIDVDEERAENYFKFFAERGGSIQLKNRQMSEIQEEKNISSSSGKLPSDEFPDDEDEIDISDFDILMDDEGSGNKESGSPLSEQKNGSFIEETDSDTIDSILEMEDEFSLSLDSDENDDFSPSFEEEALDELSSETALQFQEEKNKLDESADKTETVLKHTVNENENDSGAETVINPRRVNENRNDSGAETVINPRRVNENRSDSGAETVINPQVDENDLKVQEIWRTPYDDAFKTCLSCRKSFSGHMCPDCYPEECRVGIQDDNSDVTLTNQFNNKIVSSLFSRSSHKDKKMGLPVLLTEGFLLTFITAVISSCLYFTMPQKNIIYHLIASFIPLIGMVLIHIIGGLSLSFKRKKESKGTHSLVRAFAATAMVLTYPGQWVILGNKKFYEKKKLLFSGKKIFFINMILTLATILCLTTTIFLSKSDMFHLGGKNIAQNASKGENGEIVMNGTKGTNVPSIQEEGGQKTIVTSRYTSDSDTNGHKHSGLTTETNHKFTSSVKGKILGKRVKITLTNRNEFIGTVIGEGKEFYTLKSYKFGGTAVFSILKADITHIAMAPLKKHEKEHFITTK